jgi:hypothetical protein
MAAHESLNPWQFQQGQCGTYAHTLQRARPSLKIGLAGDIEDDNSFPWQHVFAHDETHAYDSLGTHPLPYKGSNDQWSHNELGYKDVYEAGFDPLYEEHGPEGPDEAISHAQKLQKKLGQV